MALLEGLQKYIRARERVLDACERPWETLAMFTMTRVFTKQGGRRGGEKGCTHMNRAHEERMKSHKVRDGLDAPSPANARNGGF